MKKWIALLAMTLPSLALWTSPSVAQKEYPPGEVHLTPKVDLHLQPTPIEGLPRRTLNLPPGFKVKLFSNKVDKARFMAFSEKGVLHLANMHTRGKSQWSPDPKRTSEVLAFLDPDGDGKADSVYVAADNFLWPHSIAFYKSHLYVADHDMIYKMSDSDGDGFYEGRENFIKVPGIMGRASEHITHSLVFDEQNEKLYFQVGSGCDLCREDDPERATILQFNADGTGRRIYASGLRNAIGIDLHPITGQVWAAGNGHDREGTSLPPEWINIIPDNSFHGWPLSFGYQKWVDFSISQYKKSIFPITAKDSALVASVERPVALVPAHLAPMALHFYTQDQFPIQYKNAAFVAFRAGANGNDPGYKVSVVFSEPDGSNARVGDFITGFRPDPDTNDFWGTPVGLITDDQGFLYLTSDRFVQAIFRIEASSLQGIWENPPAEKLLAGETLRINSTLRIIRQPDAGQSVRAIADLSAFGGPAEFPLEQVDDVTYKLETDIPTGSENGRKNITIALEQAGERNQLVRSVVVLPDRDHAVYDDQLRWNQGALFSAELEESQTDTTFSGDTALRVTATGFTIEWLPQEPINPAGYTALRFSVHPGQTQGGFRPSFSVTVNTPIQGGTNQLFSVLEQLDINDRSWQVVEVPLDELPVGEGIESLRIVGSLRGTFYIDDMRLVAERPVIEPTVVREAGEQATPTDVVLKANYPNPFNAQTTLRYRLNATGPVKLDVYSLSGQKVRTLVQQTQEAGVYNIAWNGQDADGRSVASGVYLACLKGAGAMQVQKMLLLK